LGADKDEGSQDLLKLLRAKQKPFSPIFEKTHSRLDAFYRRPVSRKRVLMVGDFIRSDIQGALDFGYCSALVLTGVTTRKMLARSDVKPDLVFESLGRRSAFLIRHF
jgi:ribonucleotide monophosphatase NagD (HAD superfamily)